jgi:glycosyltransferase involved in cell wall biosynthesis
VTRNPLVSVLIVTYNQRSFVDEAIRSAITQDHEPLEIVVSDDGSTDGTVEKIAQWAQAYPGKIIALIGQPNVGITGNCNRALHASTGQYVAFGAGDDLFLPGKLSAQVAWLEEDSSRVLCGHDVEVFESDSNARLYLWSDRYPLRTGADMADLVLRAPYASASIMVRRSAIPSYGFDERLPLSSDAKMWVDCLRGGGRYGYVRGLYGRYRKHAGSVTNVDDRRKSEALYKDMLSFYAIVAAEYPRLDAVCRRTRAHVCWGFAGWYLRRGEKENAAPYLREALTYFVRSQAIADGLIAVMPGGSTLRALMHIRRTVRSTVVTARGRFRRMTS